LNKHVVTVVAKTGLPDGYHLQTAVISSRLCGIVRRKAGALSGYGELNARARLSRLLSRRKMTFVNPGLN
jgi:hypothetical protein